jgi:hypothetical protein
VPATVPAAFDPEDWTKVPGVVGELMEWYDSTTLYPSRAMSLGTALSVLSTLMGQHVETPTGRGAQLFVNIVAPTTFGKDHYRRKGEKTLETADAANLKGPPDIFSSSGLIEELKTRPLPVFCAFWDEFGPAIERSMAGDASWARDLIINLQKLFTCWQENFGTPAAARKVSVAIWSPFVSICGFSPPSGFYGACSMGLSAGGFLNRLLNFEQRIKPPMHHENAEKPREAPDELAGRLRALYLFAQAIEVKMLSGTLVVKMTWGSGAKQVWIDLEKKMSGEPDEQRRELFGRAPEITVRVASVIAFGRFSRAVEVADMLLAEAIVLQSAEILYAGVLEYAEEKLSLNKLCKKIVGWVRAAGGSMTVRDVMRKARPLIAKGGDPEGTIEYLVDSGELRRRKASTGGRPSDVLESV